MRCLYGKSCDHAAWRLLYALQVDGPSSTQPPPQQQLGALVAQHVDLQLLRQLAATAAVPPPAAPLPPPARTYRVSLGVAHDAAFQHYFAR